MSKPGLYGVTGGVKRRKKRTLIERLKEERSTVVMLNQQLVNRLQLCIKVLKEFSKEENWAVVEHDVPPKLVNDKLVPQEPDTEIRWVGEGEVVELATEALKALRKGIENEDKKFQRAVDAQHAEKAKEELRAVPAEPKEAGPEVPEPDKEAVRGATVDVAGSPGEPQGGQDHLQEPAVEPAPQSHPEPDSMFQRLEGTHFLLAQEASQLQ